MAVHGMEKVAESLPDKWRVKKADAANYFGRRGITPDELESTGFNVAVANHQGERIDKTFVNEVMLANRQVSKVQVVPPTGPVKQAVQLTPAEEFNNSPSKDINAFFTSQGYK